MTIVHELKEFLNEMVNKYDFEDEDITRYTTLWNKMIEEQPDRLVLAHEMQEVIYKHKKLIETLEKIKETIHN